MYKYELDYDGGFLCEEEGFESYEEAFEEAFGRLNDYCVDWAVEDVESDKNLFLLKIYNEEDVDELAGNEIFMKKFIFRVCEILNRNYYERTDEDCFIEEIYVDYRDKGISLDKIVEFMDSDDPRYAFEDYISDCEFEYEIEHGYGQMCKLLRENLTEQEEEYWDNNEEKINEWLQEHVSWRYDRRDLETNVKVNIMLDTGDGYYDFTKNNILNWYASNGYGDGEGGIDELSPILWLARQQGKEKEVVEACKRFFVDEETETSTKQDKFVESIVQELENICSHMSTLTFLVNMDLEQLFDLHDAIQLEKPYINQYRPQDSETRGTITLSKSTMCGLFDPWNGCSSVLEIDLDKDVVIPIKYVWNLYIESGRHHWNYGVNEVCGLCDSAWDGEVKEINKWEEK